MKQAATDLGSEIESAESDRATGRFTRARGGRARGVRAQNVRALFGLWLGLFSFAVAWAGTDLWQTGGAMASQGVWLQLVVLVASTLFYLGARPICESRARLKLCVAPVLVSLVACVLAVGSVLAHSGPAALAPKADPAFWRAVRQAHFGNAFPNPAARAVRKADGTPPTGKTVPASASPSAIATGQSAV